MSEIDDSPEDSGNVAAAEYVLGVLSAADRADVERRLPRDTILASEVAFWEERLGSRYLRLRFEDLCLDRVAVVGEIFGFFGLAGDVVRIAAEEVAAPETLGRWRLQDAAAVAALEQRAGAALERFGYQSSSA